MGTNYYIKTWDKHESDDPKYHIGKRSAAGLYCFACDITLCKDGLEGVHKGDREWYKKCPMCDKEPEYGCSFTFTMNTEDISKKATIVDEYGRKFTLREFFRMTLDCPIKFYKIGEWFC